MCVEDIFIGGDDRDDDRNFKITKLTLKTWGESRFKLKLLKLGD